MAYSSTNPVNLQNQGIAGFRIWHYQTTEGTTIVLTATGYFSDGVSRGMKLGDLIFAYGSSAGSSQGFAIGIVSSVSTVSTAPSVGGALLAIVISTNP